MELPVLPAMGNPCLENGCSACCHDVEMLLTEADLARLRKATGHDGFWFLAEDGFLQLATRDEAGRPCVFLDGGLCSVRDDRPEGCRLYPAVFDGHAILDAEHCPHTGGFQLPGWADQAVRRLADTLEAERRRRQGNAL